MNKKTTLLGLLGLAAVAGGGYLVTSGQASQLPRQVGEYLPQTVRDYLPASFSPQTTDASGKLANEALSEKEASPDANESSMAVSQQSAGMADSIANDQALAEEAMNQNEAGKEQLASDAVNADSLEIDPGIVGEIEQSVSEMTNKQTTESTADATIVEAAEMTKGIQNSDQAVDHDKQVMSEEAQELIKQLEMAKSKLSGLDNEKQTLEERFQNVLKQNRELALKLKEIDDQLKVNMR